MKKTQCTPVIITPDNISFVRDILCRHKEVYCYGNPHNEYEDFIGEDEETPLIFIGDFILLYNNGTFNKVPFNIDFHKNRQ